MFFLKALISIVLIVTFSNVRAEIFVPEMICPNDKAPWLADISLEGKTWSTANEARKAGERYAQRMKDNGGPAGCKVNDIFVGNINERFRPLSQMSSNDKKRYAQDNSKSLLLLICDQPQERTGTVAMNMARALTQWAANNPNAFGYAMTSPTYSNYCSNLNYTSQVRKDIASNAEEIARDKSGNIYSCSKVGSSAVCFTTFFNRK